MTDWTPQVGDGWFRISGSGWGLHWKTPAEAPAFSERYGYEKPLIKFRGFRLFGLRPIRW